MKLIWLKTLVIVVLLGGSFVFYSFGMKDVTFEVPQAISFAEIAEKIEEEVAPLDSSTAVATGALDEPSFSEEEVAEEEQVPPSQESQAEQSQDNEVSDLPLEVNLDVPFTSQAPFGNWDEVHEETCEEAAVLMAHAYYEGKAQGTIDPNVAEDVLQDMVESENLIFGYYKDTTAEETAKFTTIYYGYERVEVLENPSKEEIKRHLVEGRPVIVPTAGRMLNNPFFSGIGPIYHMVVVKGYTENGFIVNDPGTRRGADWVYPYDVLMSSIHDWVVPEGIEDRPGDILDSARRVFVIYPN